jgi:hypothetical protein
VYLEYFLFFLVQNRKSSGFFCFSGLILTVYDHLGGKTAIITCFWTIPPSSEKRSPPRIDTFVTLGLVTGW